MKAMIQRWASEIEGNVMLLFMGMIFFAAMLIFVEFRFNSDAVVFQAVSNILSGFGGAFFGIMSANTTKKTTQPPTGATPPPAVEHPPQ